MILTGEMEKERNVEYRLAGFIEKCRQAGLKVTPQRVAIYKVLAESKEHPSAEKVWQSVKQALPNVSLDTVNRTLLTFVKIGSVSILEGSGDARRYEGDTGNHQHFKCVKCRKVFDFHYRPFDDITAPARLEAKFKILKKTVYLEGLCESCQEKPK